MPYQILRIHERLYKVYDDSFEDGMVGMWSHPDLAQEQCDRLNAEELAWATTEESS